jgi:hypothetical protein
MSKNIKPRPKNHHEILNEVLGSDAQEPSSTGRSFIDYNRGNEVSAKGDREKDISIGIVDIDTSIIKHIENTIKPYIFQDGNRIPVPVIYGYPERWQTIQEKGVLREYSGRMIAPVIVLKRDSIENNRTLGTKIDPSVPYNLHVFETSYTKKNQYDNFSVLGNRIPVKEFRLVVTPEYLTLKYSCVIFTNHLEQNNKIIEAFQYDENSYWGEENRFQFRVMIDAFNTSTEYSVGDDRTTRTNFNITLNGYIIPDTINKEISYPRKFLSKSQVIFNIETDTTEIFTAGFKSGQSTKKQAVSFPTSNRSITVVDPATLAYVNANKQLVATTLTVPGTATFVGASILQPPTNSGLPATTVNDFRFFINGQYIQSSLVTLTQVGSNVVAVFNTGALGYTLDPNVDNVMAIGKFN